MTSLVGRYILIVEDEPLLAFDYADELSARGARPSVAFTLAEGLATLAAGYPDMAVLDLNLGQDLSWPVAEALSSKGIPFLIVTGREITGKLPAGIFPVECIDKPVGAHVIADRLSEIDQAAA